MEIGINLFGPAKKLYEDFDGTLEKLKTIGFTFAEICVIFSDMSSKSHDIPPEMLEQLKVMSGGIWHYQAADEKIAAFKQQGFEIDSAHIMTDTSTPQAFLDVLPIVKAFALKHGLKSLVISLMKNLADTREFIPALNQAAGELAEIGVDLLYHNHEIECLTEDNTTPLHEMMNQCPLLKLELDVGWVQFAKVSPLDLMKKYHDRITRLHFKDIRPDASPETRSTCFTAIGEGSIPLAEIMALAPDCQLSRLGLIIDQDDSTGDLLEDLETGIRNIREAGQDV